MPENRRRMTLLALPLAVGMGARAEAQIVRAPGSSAHANFEAGARTRSSLSAPLALAPSALFPVNGPALHAALAAPAPSPGIATIQSVPARAAAAADPIRAAEARRTPAAAPAAVPPAGARSPSGEAGPDSPDPLGREFDALFDGGRGGALDELSLDAPFIPEDKRGQFVVPNERHPKDMRPLLEKLPRGAYVTVGTERGFLAAAMAPQVTHLVLLDIDPAVTAYNRTNIALLRLARDRREYARLRGSRRESWVALARERAPELAPLLADAENFREWRKYQTRNLSGSLFARVRDAAYRFRRDHLGWTLPPAYGEESRMPEFEDANYLRDDVQFARVKALADAGRIRTARVDLSNGRAVRRVTGALASSGVPLSALDLSNAWDSVYLKARPVIGLLEAFAGVASPASLLIATEGGSSVIGYTAPAPWLYYGFRFGDIAGRVETAARKLFGYGMRGYASNALNEPALPDDRPVKPAYDHERRPHYWWEDTRIDPPLESVPVEIKTK